MLLQLDLFSDAAWDFIMAIYESNWDQLQVVNGISFRNKVVAQFNNGTKNSKDNHLPKLPTHTSGLAHAKVSKVPPTISPHLLPEALKKVQEERKKERSMGKAKSTNKSFAQAVGVKPENLLKLQEVFPKLPAKKIIEMENVGLGKTPSKPKIQITIKGPSRKNILIPMDATNRKNILDTANTHIRQINSLMKSYKSHINIDCIRESGNGITVTTSSVANTSDLFILEKYFKGLGNLKSKDISPHLPQSKSFLKILGVPYFDNALNSLNTSQVENSLSKTCIFNNITLSSCPRVIQAFKNSDMVVIWVDIWDSQNGTKAKTIINRSFNFGRHIAMVRGTTMNPGIPQCHNCLKWEHTTFAYQAHRAKCQKYGGPHKLEHHRDLAWCCKGNDKTNPPQLETKKGELCLYSFKCISCKKDHLADDAKCPFWKHWFNREWHTKKAQELRETQANSIRSSISGHRLWISTI